MAERLMVSQPKISHLENGNRAISPRDVRDLCVIYEVTDQQQVRSGQVIDSLMAMARESGERGWWHPYGELSGSVYIGLETDAASLHIHAPTMVPARIAYRPDEPITPWGGMSPRTSGHTRALGGWGWGCGWGWGGSTSPDERARSGIPVLIERAVGGHGRNGSRPAPGGRVRSASTTPA